MKKLLNVILFLPLFGILSPYIFFLLTFLDKSFSYGSMDDPKNSYVGFLYEPIKYFLSIAFFSFIIGFIILIIDFRNRNLNIFKISKIFYIVSVLLCISIIYFDPYGILNWFFD